MDLNELVYSRLSGSERLVALLTRYYDGPAIFTAEFPPDQSEGWNGEDQYPRILYRISMQANQERSSSGTIRITIYGRKDPVVIEEIEDLVKGCLTDVLLKPEGEAPFSVAWFNTEPFSVMEMAVFGKEITLDLIEYPDQTTTDPDPVMALSTYIKDLFPDFVVLGIDQIGEVTLPSEKPVIFCRLDSIASADGTCLSTISWLQCVISVHVLCSDQGMRMRITGGLNQKLAIDTEVIMVDDSPMEIRALRMNARADYLREGQLAVTGYYGVLKDAEYYPTIQHGYIDPSYREED